MTHILTASEPSQQLGPDEEALLDDLRRRFDVVTEAIEAAGLSLEFHQPRSVDDLISEDDFDRDGRLPYWAFVWPSARALAGRLAKEEGRGRRLLELGWHRWWLSPAASRCWRPITTSRRSISCA
jgi:hypothetical protein